MSSLKEMAREYKIAAAKLAISIDRHQKDNSLPPWQLTQLKKALRDVRATAHLLSSYYEAPRDSELTLQGLTARRTQDDH